jgi:hypothetical protein
MCDFFPDWDDIGLAGAMGEEMADEELDRRRLEAESEADEDPEE